MKVVTANEMRNIDKITIEEVGIPSVVLMERAGVAVAKHVAGLFGIGQSVTIVCGAGNNGGDGLVCARELSNNGFEVKVVILSEIDRLSAECKKQYEICEKFGIESVFKTIIDESDIESSIIVDAILGTGIDRPIKDDLAATIDLINNTCNRTVVSVDIPTGISSETGQVMGKAIVANSCVTFGLPKRGHLLYPGKAHTGSLVIEDIGFPTALLNAEEIRCEILEKEIISLFIPQRDDYSHKGNYGHVLVIGGAKGKTGAALIAARASMRTGAGLVTLAVPDSLYDSYQCQVVDEMILGVTDDGMGGFSIHSIDAILDFANEKSCTIAIGCGLEVTDDTIALMKQLLVNAPNQMVIDADGINCIAKNPKEDIYNLLSNTKTPPVLTPHTGEMARLMGPYFDIKDTCIQIESNRINTASKFSMETSTYLALKGVPTIIGDPDGMSFINPTGSPSMATAGSGDCLTGMIASFMSQGLPALLAVQLGVYIHGLSGEICAEQIGIHATTASNIVKNIGQAFRFLIKNE